MQVARQWMNQVRQRLSDISITNKLAIFYVLILIISITVCTLLYQQIYSRLVYNKIGEASIQILYSIKSSVNQTIDNLNNYSKMTLANEDLQSTLRNRNIYSDLATQKRVHEYLVHLIEAVPQIESVYFFDNESHEYMVGNLGINQFKLGSIEDASWYHEVLDNNGSYILKLNGGGAFFKDEKRNFVSMIRVVRDTESIKPIGILILNIRESAFQLSYGDIVDQYKTNITLLDENKESIVNTDDATNELEGYLSKVETKEYDVKRMQIDGDDMIVSHLRDSQFNWNIVSMMPVRELSSESRAVNWIGVAVIVMNSILLFIGSVFISRMITTPIKKLLASMRGIERGVFKPVEINVGRNEIGRLRDGYNIMISEIQNLIKRVIEEHKIKRQTELNLLQAQIKPHFLYNTLDSINALAITGKTDEVSEIVEALGHYYRINLSKGREIITIGEELDGLRSYLAIQKIRYGSMFDVVYEVDERILNRRIPKLILQPLVENALYHGIRAQGEPGVITVTANLAAGSILLQVADDGAGMDEEMLQLLSGEKLDSDAVSFGVRGTMERLRIFFGVDHICQIESKPGNGTKVTIQIPDTEGSEHDRGSFSQYD
ncbi:sensor histidine kinase [Paenibacillus roseus]|uniref:histidine kinase n=1 Tax=Paenibacillus roseus TaxID=2798579 RepID=A0A934J753_9BACL|nr:sensor histidine kinase [Paenibacillus roseus]MBJ6362868.1 sensor histidine kinase [Paenibacillus roseus]